MFPNLARDATPTGRKRPGPDLLKTVKCEELYLNDYETFDDVVAHQRLLDQVYDEQRLHSVPGCFSPVDFEARPAQQGVLNLRTTFPASALHPKRCQRCWNLPSLSYR